MNIVMEDFVTFELAKKLKEKGYPQAKKNTLAMYDEDGDWYSLAATIDDEYCFEVFDDYSCVCPTISQVLKWLREKKYIHIDIALWEKGWYYEVWVYEHKAEEKEYSIEHKHQSIDYAFYELAALAGIEYCLDNLI